MCSLPGKICGKGTQRAYVLNIVMEESQSFICLAAAAVLYTEAVLHAPAHFRWFTPHLGWPFRPYLVLLLLPLAASKRSKLCRASYMLALWTLLNYIHVGSIWASRYKCLNTDGLHAQYQLQH